MSAFENVYRLVKDWQLQARPTEMQYRKALTTFLREQLEVVPTDVRNAVFETHVAFQLSRLYENKFDKRRVAN